jgi:hypothetical protein
MIGSAGVRQGVDLFSGTTGAIFALHRRTLYRTVRTKHTAVARRGAQQRLAMRAFVEKLAGVGRHRFSLREGANRAHKHGFSSDMISECHLKLRTTVRCQELVQERLSVSMIGHGWLFLRLAHCSTVFARTDSILRNCLSFALTRLSFSTASFSTRSQSEYWAAYPEAVGSVLWGSL